MTRSMRKWRLGRLVLVAYLVALAASHVVRVLPRQTELGSHQVLSLVVVDPDGTRTKRKINTTYLEWGREHQGQQPTVLLIHGSPGAANNFAQLAPLLADHWHVVAPDLPGFGPLHTSVPSLSIAAHADYVDQLLDRLKIDQAHVVGFSLGGAVAIDLLDPVALPQATKVQSLTLLSATGVQEHELFGSYTINHAVHGLQLLGLNLLHNATPHFGALDDSMLSVNYARNFFESDQRPMRAILQRLQIPTLVLHGKEDSLVPVDAALEHHRIVPHSSLELTNRGHLMVFFEPQQVATKLNHFFGQVEDGAAATRAEADADRLARAALPPMKGSSPIEGLALVTLMSLIAVGTWVSEDLATIGAGLLVGDQQLSFVFASMAAILGIVTGDLGIYAAGRWLGPKALHRVPLKWMLPSTRIQRAQTLFEKQGSWLVFASRFTPGTRVATYFAAGLVRTSAWRFLVYLLLAAVLWVPALVAVSAAVGEPIFDLIERFRSGGWLIALAAVAALWWLTHTLPLLATPTGRLRFLARWQRRLRWEYWPSWLIYVPLLPYLIWLAIRHRGLTFTAANPGMVDGGVIGESKSEILKRLPPKSTPPFIVVDPSSGRPEAIQKAQTFLADYGPPVVLKPDIGERGRGVFIVQTSEQIESYLDNCNEVTICQVYAAGEEFGVVWFDRPDEPEGEVFSVAEKRLPVVVGDGKQTLGELILHHPRVRHHADRYWAYREDIDEIPKLNQRVALGDLGTHCRGATFVDARHLGSPALEQTLSHISRSANLGVGRYDLRTPSVEDLRSGTGITILEFNGVSGEAAHIYDPNASFVAAIRTLATQWRKAFELGSRNRNAGHPTMPVLGFITRSVGLVFKLIRANDEPTDRMSHR